MTKAQEVYERVEAIVATGVRKADAFRQVAEEFEQPFNSMRGAYYAHTRTLGLPASPRQRKARTTNGDPIEQATSVLTRALEAIDAEVTDAKQNVEDAKAEYDHLRETAAERKKAIQAKIDALKA